MLGVNTSDFIPYATSLTNTSGAAGYLGSATAFRSKKYNFIFVGDGGFNSNNNNGSDITTAPFWTSPSPNYTPIQKTSYGNAATGGPAPVNNSIFTANAIAWALERATSNGINPH